MVETAKSTRILTSALTWFFVPHGAEFEEREAAVHGEHQNGADQ